MNKHNKQALQVAKEIVVKFIEVGRVSPQNFGDIFSGIHRDVLEAIRQGEAIAAAAGSTEPKGAGPDKA